MCVCVRGHANPWSQMKPSGMDAAGLKRRAKGGHSSAWLIMSKGGGQNQFDMRDHGGCIQSAPNSLLKQIQLQQRASFRDYLFPQFGDKYQDSIQQSLIERSA